MKKEVEEDAAVGSMLECMENDVVPANKKGQGERLCF
jgi:hypothetical protein